VCVLMLAGHSCSSSSSGPADPPLFPVLGGMWSPPSARGHLPSGSANGEARLTSAPPPPPRRAYLVTPDWLTQSLANSEIVDEIDYSIKGVFPDSTVTPRDINKRVRHCPPRQVLMGKSVCTRRAFKGMPQDELAMIVEAAGATLLGSMPSAGDLPPGCIVIGDPGHKLTRSAGASDAMAVDIQEEEEEERSLIVDLKRHTQLAVAWNRHGSPVPRWT
jgi:hypothetical protein